MTYNYNKSNQFYDKIGGPVFCSCMGPVYGEPFCPCQMSELGLPLSQDHLDALEWDKASLDAALRYYGWQ